MIILSVFVKCCNYFYCCTGRIYVPYFTMYSFNPNVTDFNKQFLLFNIL